MAFSGKNAAWAVGCVCYGSSASSGVVLHWTGTQWKVAGRLFDALPEAVAVGPGGQAWLVGHDPAGANGDGAFSSHWNGKTWRWVAVPRQTAACCTASPTSPAVPCGRWARGRVRTCRSFCAGPGRRGRRSRRLAAVSCNAVAGYAANDGWAVGGDGKTTTILHWNGKAWS